VYAVASSPAARPGVARHETVLDGHLLLFIDGSGFNASEKIGSDYCLTEKKRNGAIEYHLQMLAGGPPLFIRIVGR
jgi:hypothetical protein